MSQELQPVYNFPQNSSLSSQLTSILSPDNTISTNSDYFESLKQQLEEINAEINRITLSEKSKSLSYGFFESSSRKSINPANSTVIDDLNNVKEMFKNIKKEFQTRKSLPQPSVNVRSLSVETEQLVEKNSKTSEEIYHRKNLETKIGQAGAISLSLAFVFFVGLPLLLFFPPTLPLLLTIPLLLIAAGITIGLEIYKRIELEKPAPLDNNNAPLIKKIEKNATDKDISQIIKQQINNIEARISILDKQLQNPEQTIDKSCNNNLKFV